MASTLTQHSLAGRSAGCRAAPSRCAQGAPRAVQRHICLAPMAVWTRPTPDKDDDFIKPSYVPTRPSQDPVIQPYRREDQPLYSPVPSEFRPAELPDKAKEMPDAPKMPERRPDPIPAGNPKEKPTQRPDEQREAPPPKTDTST